MLLDVLMSAVVVEDWSYGLPLGDCEVSRRGAMVALAVVVSADRV